MTTAYSLPTFSVDTRQLPQSIGFDAWQNTVIPYWDAAPLDKNAETFESATQGFLIGDMMLGTVQTPSQRITRSRYGIARDGLSQYGMQLIIKGGIGKPGGLSEEWASNPGDLLVADLTQTQMLEAHDLSVIYFSVPRDRLAPLLNNPDHHNERVLSAKTPMVSLLTSHLATTLKVAPSLDAAQADAVMNATLELTAAALNAQLTEATGDVVLTGLVQAIRRYIEQHIRDNSVSASAVAARFCMSRRKLYYLFEPFGGFATYVRERRLHHVRKALADPENKTLTTADLAEIHGFTNYSGFARAFRRFFGVSPREVRALATQGHVALHDIGGENIWYDWLLRTR